MSKLVGKSEKAVDHIQQTLTEYGCGLNYDKLPPEVIHSAKVRIIDTLGALIAGFSGEPCQMARVLASQVPDPAGASIIGTRIRTPPDMAAFVNGTTARFAELTDIYHWPGSFGGHPSDLIMPVLAVAEHMHVSGREFLTSIVLGYEVYLRVSDIFHGAGFDHTTLSVLGTAIGAGKLFGLSSSELSHCISMAIVPNNILQQVRTGHLSMFKAVATGQAGRAGVFAALLARAGMEGPHLPFIGKAGWCDHIAREKLVLNRMGGDGTPFKIPLTLVKNRASNAVTISSILAAEKIAPIKNVKDIKQVTIEVYKRAKERIGTDRHHWNPTTREAADHSGSYIVAATLIDGTVTPRSFNDAHLWNPELRDLMQKIEFVENEEFTTAYEQLPQQHRTRITVASNTGERLVGESGGDEDDLSGERSDAKIAEKFRRFTEDVLGAKRVDTILERLWLMDEIDDVAKIPPAFVIC